MWVLIDLEKRSILRPSAIDEIGTLPPSEDDLFDLVDVRRIIDQNSLSRTNVLQVRYSHLDMNNHLNNTFYSDFVFDCISPECHTTDKGLYLQINYKAEARLGDELYIYSVRNDDGSFDFSADNISNEKNCFTAYVSFEN